MRRLLGVLWVLPVVCAVPGPAAADAEADMKAVIAKAMQAHGGAEALNKYRAVRMTVKGQRDVRGEATAFDGVLAFQLPDRLRAELETVIKGKKHKIIQVLRGDEGWVSLDGKTLRMDGELLAQVREQIYTDQVTRLAPLGDKEFRLSPLGERKVAGRDAVGVRVEHKGHRPIRLYFDKADGLLLLSETRVRSETRATRLGERSSEVTQETYYEDYKKVNGVQVAHKTRVRRDGKPFLEAEATEVRVAEKLPEETFARP
jgi:hypothetical protein